MKEHTYDLGVAPRKFKRMLSESVSASVLKSLTEPITNGWDSYKRLGLLRESFGLVERALQMKKGDRVDHEELVSGIRPKKRKCRIHVRISTTKRSQMEKRQCQIIDQAEGLSEDELVRTFAEYGADKSKQSQGAAVRGLFGQGISDVLWGHRDGRIISFKDAKTTELRARFSEDDRPIYKVRDMSRRQKSLRKEFSVDNAGTAVEYTPVEKCRIPGREPLYIRLCNFYMLRLINANPCCEVVLEQHRSGGSHTDTLGYALPTGEVVGRFETEVKYLEYSPVKVEAVVIRSDDPLNADSNLEYRENGLLVVDENDAVYDLTLFEYDRQPGLERLYGIVRLTGFREIARDRLQNHAEAVITDSRDGLRRQHPFAEALSAAVRKELDPIVKEELRRAKEGSKELSKEVQSRVDKAMEHLNSLFTEETGETGEEAGPKHAKVPEFECVTFDPSIITLTAGVPRAVLMYAKTAEVTRKCAVVLESNCPDIMIEPDETSLERAKEVIPGVLQMGFRLSSSIIGAAGDIEALLETRDGGIVSTKLHVRDVRVPPQLTVPEDGMEFRPTFSSTTAHRRGLTVLFVDTTKIPIGTEILFRMEDASSGLTLVDENGHDVYTYVRKTAKRDVIEGMRLAKVPVQFRGHGSGQTGIVAAKAKPRGHGKYKAYARVKIAEPVSAEHGIFRDVEYGPIRGRKIAVQFDPTSATIWVNSDHPTNRAFFGKDKSSFDDELKSDKGAQIRLAELLIDEAMFHTLAEKHRLGGKRGFDVSPDDPVGSIRRCVEEWKFDHGAKTFRALVTGFHVPSKTEPQI